MDEEIKQEVNTEKNFDLKKFDFKKYLPIIGGIVAVVIIAIVLVSVLGGGPKKAVKGFISGMNSKNAKKVLKNIDPIGMETWSYYGDIKDFEDEDYEEFIEAYEEANEEMDKDELKEQEEDFVEMMDDMFDDLDDNYKSYKMKVEEIKSSEKIGDDLYAVKAKISTYAKPDDKDVDEIDSAETMTFIVYKNKLITVEGLEYLF